MKPNADYFAELNRLLPKIVTKLKKVGIKKQHLAFGGEGEVLKGRVPTDANSEFLANRAMGDWAENLLSSAVQTALPKLKSIQYGNSDRMAAGEPGFKEFYLAGVEETRRYGKRPDLLLFAADEKVPNELSTLGHLKTAPFVKRAIASLEVRSSKFEALKYMKFRETQRADGNKSGRESPSFTVKVEDLVVVYRWLELNRMPQSYCQVFFDTVFAINFLDIFRLIASGEGFKIERPKNSQGKATIMIPITTGVPVGTVSVPDFEARHHVTKLGRHDAYVAPTGGKCVLDAEKMRPVLLPL